MDGKILVVTVLDRRMLRQSPKPVISAIVAAVRDDARRLASGATTAAETPVAAATAVAGTPPGRNR